MRFTSGLEPLRLERFVSDETSQEESSHLVGQLANVEVLARAVPVITPVHHPEKRKRRDSYIDSLDTPLACDFAKQVDHQINVLPFLGIHLAKQIAGDRVRFV